MISLVALFSREAFSGAREQAYRLHNRLASVPPTTETLNQMETLIKNGIQKKRP